MKLSEINGKSLDAWSASHAIPRRHWALNREYRSTYRDTVVPTEKVEGMAVWRETVFAFLQRNAERTAAFFGVPTKQVVEFGTEIEI